MPRRSSTRVSQQPGGGSSLGYLFGGSAPVKAKVNSSSNNFASGSNQNAGNVITGRSTTRIHAPPGGRSQICLTGGYGDSSAPKAAARSVGTAGMRSTAAPVQRGTSSNHFASGSNQNAGNVITNRSSTRIHAPPGGRSQISFGGGSFSDSKPAQQYNKRSTGRTLTETSRTNVRASAPAPVQKTTRGTSSNRFATGSNQNAGNVITDRSSTRIHAPPGGRSSITFG